MSRKGGRLKESEMSRKGGRLKRPRNKKGMKLEILLLNFIWEDCKTWILPRLE